MTHDEIQKLKALALAATQDGWQMNDLGSQFGLRTRSGYQAFFPIHRANAFVEAEGRASAAFFGTCTPPIILSLIAQLEARPAVEDAVLPKWIDDAKGKDPFIDDLIAEIIRLRAAPPSPAVEAVSERDMAIAQAVRHACCNAYSPDDSVHDWTEKVGDIDLATVIRRAAISRTATPAAEGTKP